MKRNGLFRVSPAAVAILAAMSSAAVPAPTQAASLEQQREWYNEAKEALDREDLPRFRRLRSKLKDYPLVPYLGYRAFVGDLSNQSPADFSAFNSKYSGLPFLGTVRSRYLLNLADRGAWRDLLRVQPESPRDEALRCVFFRALYATGRRQEAFKGARTLWLTGRSMSGRCDPLFEAWKQAGGLTSGLRLDRMLLAYQNGNARLLRHLFDRLPKNRRRAGQTIVDLYKWPKNAARFSKASRVSDFNRQLAQAAFKRWARKDAKAAIAALDRTARGQRMSTADRKALAEYTASQLMSSEDRRLAQWRDQQLKQSENVRLLERRIRLALRRAEWSDAQRWIDRLPVTAQKTSAWTFWRGRLAGKAGKRKTQRKVLTPLLGKANYYSAAAATVLNEPIQYPVTPTPDETTSVDPYRMTLARISELIALDLIGDAKREWRRLLLRAPDTDTKLALAKYAEQQKWYHLTVQATIAGRFWSHMNLRFPIAFRWWFEFFSKERNLPIRTMLAIARLESALDAQAQSRAGARGLLQLLPSTAREAARKVNFKYGGAATLFDPGVNIRLGSSYLKTMLERCDGNRIRAFASYNAGYTRVRRWLKETNGKLDIYAFIEQIPFNETRGYVQNGLMFEIYYGRLLGETPSLFRPAEARARY